MRILFCTDGSEISYYAIKNFAKWAVKDVVVDIICVIDWSYLPDDVVVNDIGFVSGCRNIANDILNTSEIMLKDLGITVGEKIKLCGSAVSGIIETSEGRNYSMIILGSNGKKGIQKWIGSVSKSVLEGTGVPTYISKMKNASKNILFATDGSEDFEGVIDFAVSNLSLEGKKIYLCVVNETPDLLFLNGTLDDNWRIALDKKQNMYALNALEKIKTKVKSNNFDIEEAGIISGVPAKSIIEYSNHNDIDLIVASTHINRKRMFLIDTVSSKIVENVRADVLVIKL